MSKVSLIIPVCNVEKYIQQCLESVINQTFRDIEIICIDDCGNDNSIKIAEEYAKKDSRIKIIHHKKNLGLGPTRNTGIRYSNSDYIFFLDSDDYIEENVIENLYNKAEETQSDIVIMKAKAFSNKNVEKLNKITERKNKWLSNCNAKIYQITPDNYADAIDHISCTVWGKLFRKKFFTNNNLSFINKNVVGEDNGFWLKVCSCFPSISYIDNIGLMYRIRPNSIVSTLTQKKKIKDVRVCIKDACKYIKKHANNPKILMNQIKNSKEYNPYWYIRIPHLFKYKWTLNDKNIRFIGISIVHEYKINETTKIRKVFGIKTQQLALK